MFRMPKFYRHLYPASWGIIHSTLSMNLRENFSELTLVKQKSRKGWNSGSWGEGTRQQERESGKTWGHLGHSLFSSRAVPNEPYPEGGDDQEEVGAHGVDKLVSLWFQTGSPWAVLPQNCTGSFRNLKMVAPHFKHSQVHWGFSAAASA